MRPFIQFSRHSLCCALSLLFGLAAVPSIALGQSWSVRPVFPQNSDINGVQASAAGLIIAVGNDGLIERSADSGKTWQLNTSFSSNFRGVATADFENFTAVSSEGDIAVSHDSGVTWTMTAHAPKGLWAVNAASHDTVIAVGVAGFVTRSTDKGLHWEEITSPTTEDLFAVIREGPAIIACGDAETILLSQDGGTTWHIQSTKPSSSVVLRGLSSNHADALFAYGDSMQVRRSNDLGVSWSTITVDSTKEPELRTAVRTMFFFDSSLGYLSVANLYIRSL